MPITTVSASASAATSTGARESMVSLPVRRFPATMRETSYPVTVALGVLILAAYGRVLAQTVSIWLKDDNYTHGLLVAPLIVWLAWRQRAELRPALASAQPTLAGAVTLTAGLVLLLLSHFFQIPYIGYWSLPVTLSGVLLAVYGPALWRIVRFPILYLLVAGPLPDFFLSPVSGLVQRLSSTGAAALMQECGYTLMQNGNLIELPGITLEVADVCSGFKKMIALVAFALLFGHLTGASPLKRTLLVLAALPIAIVANILRISALIGVAAAGGENWLKTCHDGAEVVAVLLSLALFLLVGKVLRCSRAE